MTQEARLRGHRERVTLVRLENGEQTPRFRTLEAIAGVYPRACGGTRPGNATTHWGGAVPADFELVAPRADAPVLGGSCPGISRTRGPVYPRGCGGTAWFPSERSSQSGLSPCLRGNLIQNVPDDRKLGLSPRLRGNLVVA